MNTKIIGSGILITSLVFCIARAFEDRVKPTAAILPKNTEIVWLAKNNINTSPERERQ